MLQLLANAADPTSHVLPHELFHIGHWFSFNNQMLMTLLSAVLMVVVFRSLFKDASGAVPTGARNFFESILEFLRIEVFRPALKEHTDRFVPFLWTLFFFILFANLLGQIPVDEFVTLASGGQIESHVWGTATGSILTTGALAMIAFFFVHANGIRQVANDLIKGTYGHHGGHEEHSSHEAAHDLEHPRGEGLPADVPADVRALANPTAHYADDEHIKHHQKIGNVHVYAGQRIPPNIAWISAFPLYIWNFAPHPFRPAPGAPWTAWIGDIFMWGFLLILELIGALIKPFALTVRLFANMISGHIVLASLIILIPVTAGPLLHFGIGIPVTLLSLMIRLLEVFVAFLQAYIFTFLTTLFIASAVAPEH
jgi:F0F1-type ATP synthase membrane subunit a